MEDVWKPRIYLRQLMTRAADGVETMNWLWMGSNPNGHDWSLGGVRLFTLEQAVLRYARKLHRARRTA